MALGRTHEVVNMIALPVFFYYLPKELYIPFGLGYLIGTFLLSPDIDLPNSKPTRRWKLLRFIWFPYQSFSKHRGISHLPVIGSLLRLAYIIGVVLFLYFFLIGVVSVVDKGFSMFLSSFNPFETLNSFFKREESLYFVGGIICADIVHIILDGLSSLIKKIT